MPENDHAHPRHTIPETADLTPNPPAPFVELGLATCFSFLRGASDAADFALTAWQLGYDQLGCADVNSFAGVVRHYTEAHKAHIRPITGTRIALVTGEVFLASMSCKLAEDALGARDTTTGRHAQLPRTV